MSDAIFSEPCRVSVRTVAVRAVLAAALGAAIPAGAVQAQERTTPSVSVNAQQIQTAWARLQQAFTPEQQANEARSTARLLAASGVRIGSLEMDVKNIATGRTVPRDDPSILQRPQAHEVTFVVDGRFYTFRPLSRASLEAFTGR